MYENSQFPEAFGRVGLPKRVGADAAISDLCRMVAHPWARKLGSIPWRTHQHDGFYCLPSCLKNFVVELSRTPFTTSSGETCTKARARMPWLRFGGGNVRTVSGLRPTWKSELRGTSQRLSRRKPRGSQGSVRFTISNMLENAQVGSGLVIDARTASAGFLLRHRVANDRGEVRELAQDSRKRTTWILEPLTTNRWEATSRTSASGHSG